MCFSTSLFVLCLYTNEAKPEVFYVSVLRFSWNNNSIYAKVLHLVYCAALLWQEAKSNRKERGGLAFSHCDSQCRLQPTLCAPDITIKDSTFILKMRIAIVPDLNKELVLCG